MATPIITQIYFADESLVQSKALQFLGLTPPSTFGNGFRRRLLREEDLHPRGADEDNTTIRVHGGGDGGSWRRDEHRDGNRGGDDSSGDDSGREPSWNATRGVDRIGRQGRVGGRQLLVQTPPRSRGRGGIKGPQTCWHDCGKSKSKFDDDVSPELYAQLKSFYGPMQAVLDATKQEVRWVSV